MCIENSLKKKILNIPGLFQLYMTAGNLKSLLAYVKLEVKFSNFASLDLMAVLPSV